ncbi:unnamed protein product [marine sediment metagenome]|uniref:Uncharacterized protein n=1 Tax=marine sediment metagenome TaxID=412755 RepID=X1HW79_9ZZZZ
MLVAKVVTPRGIIGPSALRPAPVYSRLIGVELRVPGGIGADAFCFTPKLGNRVTLLGVYFHTDCVVQGVFAGGFLGLMSGSGEPVSGAAMAEDWDTIIELYCGVKPWMRVVFCERLDLFWSLRRLYESNEIRFGAWMGNFTVHEFVVTVIFEVAEG